MRPGGSGGDLGDGSANLGGPPGGFGGGERGNGGGILGQDPKGPLGTIINNINARMDKTGDAERQKADAQSGKHIGVSMMAMGAAVVGAAAFFGPKTGPVGASVAGAAASAALGFAAVGFVVSVAGAMSEAAANKTLADEAEKAREAAKKDGKLPPDLLRPVAAYCVSVTRLRSGDSYATGDGQHGSATAVGVQEVAAEMLVGDGLTAFFVTSDQGHVKVPVSM